jgi:hypothetical protein
MGVAIGVALAIPVGIWVFQMVLEKNFAEFRIRLVPKAPIVPTVPSDEPR